MIPILELKDGLDYDTCKELASHLSTIGFVYLKNHGIADEKVRACKKVSMDFFSNDVDYKKSFCQELTNKHVGYKPHESERFNPHQKEKDMREAMLFDAHDVPSNVWPSGSFEKGTASLIKDMGVLADRLLHMIGIGLELESPNVLAEAHSAFRSERKSDSVSFTTFRINLYPAIEATQLKEDQVLCGEHADFGTITLLIQDHVRGLEVQMTDGTFIEAVPMEGTILVNIGLLLENWTNGRLRATRHRVVRPTPEERMSLVLFVHPDENVLVKPLGDMTDENGSGNYETVEAQKFSLKLLADIR